ncbi:hypothetical protein Ddc_18731 [Ditylenchus destructor]|nr:hypothetical protein Ddc_18731 [Ditylenchus destructor]
MENILHICTRFFPLLYIAILLIFAAFVIIVFFILGRDRKKPLKVSQKPLKKHKHPLINISSDSLHDILNFFDRKCLCRLRAVNSCFNQTIQREFANIPYLVLENFFISEFAKAKSIHDRYRRIVDEVMVNEILAEKFVRFKHADVDCNDFASVAHLVSMSEPWQTFDLKLSAEFKLTKYYARRLTKCKKVNSISFCGRLTLLPELLLGTCLKLTVSDDLFKTADSASVPWAKILDFLFRSSGTYVRCRCVDITTKDPPGYAEYLQFIDKIKQRFGNATTRFYFEFKWRANAAPLFHNGMEGFQNVHTQQTLTFNQTNYYGEHNYSYITFYTG